MTNTTLKSQMMEYLTSRPYSFGQLKILPQFQGEKSYTLGIALRNLVKSGQVRLTQIGSGVYFRKTEGFMNSMSSAMENFNRILFDRFYKGEWISSGYGRLERKHQSNGFSADLFYGTMKRNSSSWTVERYDKHSRVTAIGKRKDGEIVLKFDVLNDPNFDRVILEGQFNREKSLPKRIVDPEGYLWKIFLAMSEVHSRTRFLDTAERTAQFATDYNERDMRKIHEFSRGYSERRYPWGYKDMLQPFVTEVFANPRIGTTPRALKLKSRGFKKLQEFVDYMEYRGEKISSHISPL
jgi:hypothetical protein